jgi:hypothetical protein
MKLDQFQNLRLWHLRHQRDHPLEGLIWNTILTLWMVGWVGSPTALLLHWDVAALVGGALVFMPGSYVALRRALHRRGRLRCDWIGALR